MEDFKAKEVSAACNGYVKSQKGQSEGSLKSDDVYSLIRFAVTGNPVGAPVGDICEIIG